MRAVIQRVKNANVRVKGEELGAINAGLLVLLGIEDADQTDDINWLCSKIIQLRIFDDENRIPNLSVLDIDGEILLISQFTLFASTKKGNRPGYTRAAHPDVAIPLYEEVISRLQQISGKKIKTGKFGADMQVNLLNDGPVTIIIDTKNKDL